MVQDCKKIYTQVADRIPNWEKQTKSNLIRAYVEVQKSNNKELSDAYMSAIMLKYWSALNKYYYGKARGGHIRMDDCYDWLTQAILYTTSCHIWDKPFIEKKDKSTGKIKQVRNPLYDNPDGPNIAVSKCIISMRLGFYQASNYAVRRVNYTAASLDGIIEDNKDHILPYDNLNDPNNSNYLTIKEMIIKNFKSKNYYKAFLLDGIINGDCFDLNSDKTEQIFNKKKLMKHLRYIDDNYCTTIAETFDLNLNDVIEASKVYRGINTMKMYRIVDSTLENLKSSVNKELILER